jgi:hypothetical protein
VKRLGSIRFDGVPGVAGRDELVRLLSSAGIEVASWTASRSGARTYAALALPAGAEAEAAASGIAGARFAVPAPLAFEIVPREPARLAALQHALGGAGRPTGVVEAVLDATSLLLELEPRTSLRLVLDVLDGELAHAPGRTVVPLLPLSDEALAAFAGATLSVAGLDASRLIEHYSEPLLAGEA